MEERQEGKCKPRPSIANALGEVHVEQDAQHVVVVRATSDREPKGDGKASRETSEAVLDVVVVGQQVTDGRCGGIVFFEWFPLYEGVTNSLGSGEDEIKCCGCVGGDRIINGLAGSGVGGCTEEVVRGVVVIQLHIFCEEQVCEMLHIVNAVEATGSAVVVGEAGGTVGTAGGGKFC